MTIYLHRIIGVDPGGTTGVCCLDVRHNAVGETYRIVHYDAVQCEPKGMRAVVLEMLEAHPHASAIRLAVEAWVRGHRSIANAHRDVGDMVADAIADARNIQAEWARGRPWLSERPAGVVKPWATDKRLEACGLLARTRGMPHARDAARHALFSACRDVGLPDPLGRKGSRAS